MSSPLLCAIAAVSADGFVSRDTGVPWDLPADREHFRAITAGKWLLLGRRTFQEMLGWFKDHHPMVLTQSSDFRPQVGNVVHTVQSALDLAASEGAEEVWVCGGAATYAAAWPLVQKAVITRVAENLGSGLAFPEICTDEWIATDQFPLHRTSDREPAAEVITYQRRGIPEFSR